MWYKSFEVFTDALLYCLKIWMTKACTYIILSVIVRSQSLSILQFYFWDHRQASKKVYVIWVWSDLRSQGIHRSRYVASILIWKSDNLHAHHCSYTYQQHRLIPNQVFLFFVLFFGKWKAPHKNTKELWNVCAGVSLYWRKNYTNTTSFFSFFYLF